MDPSLPIPTLIPPPISPPWSFLDRVYRTYAHFVDPESRNQKTQWFDMDSIEVAQGLKTLQQPVFSDELEATEAEKARLITEPYIARDKNTQPILGYFPAALPSFSVEKTRRALSTYVNALAEDKTRQAKRKEEAE